MSFSNKARIACEKAIFARCVLSLLDQGFEITVNNGEDDEITKSRDFNAIVAASRTTDEDFVIVYGQEANKQNVVGAWVRFIYGNEGPTVINDYSTRLENQLKEVNAFADKLDNGDFHIVS